MANIGSQAVDFTRESEILPRDLPPKVLRFVSVVLVVFAAAVALVAFLVPLPDVVKTKFTLVPRDGADPVKAPMPGTIEKVQVSDGSEVKKGDVLFVIRSEDLGVLSERVKRMEKELEAQGPLEEKLAESAKASIKAAETRADSLGSEINFARQRKGVNSKLLGIAEGSFQKGLISETQLLSARQADADAGQGLERLRREAEDARAAVAQLKAAAERESAERAIARARLAGELAEAKASVDWQEKTGKEPGAKENTYTVSAPYDGTVTGMGPRRSGALVERGEVLCRLAREDAKLLAEIAIPELDAGRVAPGQPVKLMLDAFPYTRYGTKSATVAWVSPTASEGAVRTQASLIDAVVVVDGKQKPLRAGMVGQAHVVVGSRTLAEYALEPLRQIKENFRDVDVGAKPKKGKAKVEPMEEEPSATPAPPK
ncbi:MAG: HlyD family efflux transporter periplasmic adaptor subunit [Myxococcota bacterium]